MLVLLKNDVDKAVTIREIIEAVEQAQRIHGEGR